jgi:hypothetical protein
MPGSGSPWRLNFIWWSVTFVVLCVELSSCHLLAARILSWLLGCLENLCTPALWQQHCNSSRNSPLSHAHRICLVLFQVTLRYLPQTYAWYGKILIRVQLIVFVFTTLRHTILTLVANRTSVVKSLCTD